MYIVRILLYHLKQRVSSLLIINDGSPAIHFHTKLKLSIIVQFCGLGKGCCKNYAEWLKPRGIQPEK